MNIYQAIKSRYSVRAYKPDPIPEESLNRVLQAASLAPSAKNLQEYKFVVVKDKEKIKELSATGSSQSFIGEAPVIIVAVSTNPDYLMSCEVPAYPVDVAIAVDHLTLAAVEEGLGTCWIGAFSQDKVKEILNIPAEYKVVILLPLGFAADTPKEKSRKSIEELVSRDSF